MELAENTFVIRLLCVEFYFSSNIPFFFKVKQTNRRVSLIEVAYEHLQYQGSCLRN